MAEVRGNFFYISSTLGGLRLVQGEDFLNDTKTSDPSLPRAVSPMGTGFQIAVLKYIVQLTTI